MNDVPSPQPLPSPDERELPAGRHHLLKEHLMREITPSATDTAPDDSPAPANGTAPARRRWLRPAFAGPATAGVLALSVVVGLAVAGSGEQGGPDGSGHSQVPFAGQDQRDGAPALLESIAKEASKQPSKNHIRDDQFVYVDSLVAYVTTQEGKPPEMPKLHPRRTWVSVDGTRPGLVWEKGLTHGPDKQVVEPPVQPGEPVSAAANFYRRMASLPTDPDAMLKWLRKTAAKTGPGGDQGTFVLVGEMLRGSLAPPEVNAALYRAVARIPGVVVVPDVVDARGQTGIAVARVDTANGIRDEWIFDKANKSYLGERSVVVEEVADDFEVGDVVGTTMIVHRTVVDTAGQRP